MGGRHRRKSSDQRGFTRIAIIGSIISGGIAFAGNAGAAAQQDWDDLAECEAGGDWAINTGNGYYGGLQIASSTWAAHGGKEFGASADVASREQQIEIGQRILAAQGWGAWPACSASLNLSSRLTADDDPQVSSVEQSWGAIRPVPESVPDLQREEARAIVDRINRLVADAQSAGVSVPQPVLQALDSLTLA
ncbi:transglycosylase family protein [Nocardia brasiliensis]